MGKGKGELERWTIRVRSGLVFLEFKGFSINKIKGIQNKFQKNIQIRLNFLANIVFFYSTLKNTNYTRIINRDRFFL
jgi:hypothetical protein